MNEREVLKVDTLHRGNKTVGPDFPGNSKSNKEVVKTEEKRVVKKVIKGSVVKKKKSLGKRFIETFIGEDVKNVKDYIIHDVLIPSAKDTITEIAQGITDAIQGSIEVSLFGERRSRGRGSRGRKDSGRSYFSYNSISSRDRDRDRREVSSRNRARHNFDEIVLATRGEAEDVLGNLVDLIVDYGEASVADLYDLVGISEAHTDRKYGWKDLSSASVSRVSEGYLLNLPRTVLLD